MGKCLIDHQFGSSHYVMFHFTAQRESTVSDHQDLETSVGQISHFALTLMGRTQAYEIYLQSLVGEIVEHFPELREPLKERFKEISDLHRTMGLPEVAMASYNQQVEILMGHFKLMKGGGFFKDQ